MQIVSDNWKAEQLKVLRGENTLEITLEVSDPEAIQDASVSDNGVLDYSNTASVLTSDMIPTAYATLEMNILPLDGSVNMLPDDNINHVAYIGNEVSAQDGTYSMTPQVHITFSRVFEKLIPGITITWSPEFDEWAEQFTVTAYNGDTVVAEKFVENNFTARSIVWLDINNYDSIVISVEKWCLPFHRPRIAEIFVGIKNTYVKSDIIDYSNKTIIAPLGDKLPTANVEFKLDNRERMYDPDNPTGLTKYLMEQQHIRVKYGQKSNGKMEYIPGGSYYLSEWKSPQNGITSTFKARDIMSFMNKNYIRGVYASGGVNMYDLALDVFTNANLPVASDGSVMYEIGEHLKNYYTTAPLPICTHAECIQYIANATASVILIKRSGVISIVPFELTTSDYNINGFNSFSRPEVTLTKPLKNVEVKVYSYYKGDSVELYNATRDINGTTEVVIEYSEQAINAKATITGGTLVESVYYSNACVLKITASGTVTIVVSGTRLKKSTNTYIKDAHDVGETESVDNPLITSEAVAEHLSVLISEYLSERRSLDLDWRADVRLDVGDTVKVSNNYGDITSYVTDLTYTFKGAYRATCKGKVV